MKRDCDIWAGSNKELANIYKAVMKTQTRIRLKNEMGDSSEQTVLKL